MIKQIKLFFEQFIIVETQATEEEKQHALNLAVAAIMLEMVGMDNQVDENEMQRFSLLLKQQLLIEDEEIEQLQKLARQELADSVDYYQFTNLINQSFDLEKKCQIIKSLWELAYADGRIDSHEEHFLRKIADLLFVPHSEFIKAKLQVIPG